MCLLQDFQALTQPQQTFILQVVYSVIQKRTVCAHDLAEAIRDELYLKKPEFDYRNVTDHSQAATWTLEKLGKVKRQRKGLYVTLSII